MARKGPKGQDRPVPSSAWPEAWGTAPHLHQALREIAGFLQELGYNDARGALQRQAETDGLDIKSAGKGTAESNNALMRRWHKAEEVDEEIDDFVEVENEGGMVDDEAEDTSDDSSGGSSDSGSAAKVGQKRKRVLTPDSSPDESSDSGSDASMIEDVAKSDGSDNDSSSSDNDRPLQKRSKITHSSKKSVSSDSGGSSSSDSSSTDSSSSDSSSDSDSASSKSASSSSSSSSDSSSSSSGSSSSSSSSDSDSGSGRKKNKNNKAKKAQKAKNVIKQEDKTKHKIIKREDKPKNKIIKKEANPGSSTSSATLEADGTADTKPEDKLIIPASESKDNTVKELPATMENIKKLKKEAIPFSRIPIDQQVDPRFASNSYVSYDYADRAYQDLVVTKGKGFTKEKNKKKRGAYRGGAIDMTPKGIKFDD